MATTTTGLPAPFHTHASFIDRLTQTVSAVVTAYQDHRADKRLRETLANLRDATLLDIGIAEDEIERVRSKENFTPRSWVDDPRCRRRAA